MAFDRGLVMTNEELIAWEEQIRHAFHRMQRKSKALEELLEAFAAVMAEAYGIGPEQRSGGDADDKERDPPAGP